MLVCLSHEDHCLPNVTAARYSCDSVTESLPPVKAVLSQNMVTSESEHASN